MGLFRSIVNKVWKSRKIDRLVRKKENWLRRNGAGYFSETPSPLRSTISLSPSLFTSLSLSLSPPLSPPHSLPLSLSSSFHAVWMFVHLHRSLIQNHFNHRQVKIVVVLQKKTLLFTFASKKKINNVSETINLFCFRNEIQIN